MSPVNLRKKMENKWHLIINMEIDCIVVVKFGRYLK